MASPPPSASNKRKKVHASQMSMPSDWKYSCTSMTQKVQQKKIVYGLKHIQSTFNRCDKKHPASRHTRKGFSTFDPLTLPCWLATRLLVTTQHEETTAQTSEPNQATASEWIESSNILNVMNPLSVAPSRKNKLRTCRTSHRKGSVASQNTSLKDTTRSPEAETWLHCLQGSILFPTSLCGALVFRSVPPGSPSQSSSSASSFVTHHLSQTLSLSHLFVT